MSEDKILIKQFRDSSSNFWCDTVHYHLNEQGELIFCAGGIDRPELREALLSYIKRNKKVFKEGSPSIFEIEPKEYNAIIPIGKFKGQTVQSVYETEKKYLTWMYKNYTFKISEEKLKQEIKELLKIK